jgi:hypothetical protein
MKMASASKWLFLLQLIIIISILSCPVAGCKTASPNSPQPVPSSPKDPPLSISSNTLLIPYINERWKYTAYFPRDWYIESDMNSDDKGILDFHAPEPYHATLCIEVIDIKRMGFEPDVEMLARESLENTRYLWGEIFLKDNIRVNNNWDWRYAFEGVLWNLDCDVSVYLKQTGNFLYILTLRIIKEEFDDAYLSNLEQIPEVFVFHSA